MARLDAHDILAIQQLYARQAHAIDAGDAAGWAATFTSDGTFRSPTYDRAFAGTAELEGFVRALPATGGVQRHWTNQLLLEADGAAGATGRCYALIVVTRPGERPVLERAVTFHDRLVRYEDGWRFRSREVRRDDA